MGELRGKQYNPTDAGQCLMPAVMLLGLRDIVKVSAPFDPFEKRSTHNWYLFLCLCVLRSGHTPQSQSREAISTVCDSLASGGCRRDPTHLINKGAQQFTRRQANLNRSCEPNWESPQDENSRGFFYTISKKFLDNFSHVYYNNGYKEKLYGNNLRISSQGTSKPD